MAETFAEPPERVICPNCGKPVPLGNMNLCYRVQRDCENCGASLLIEGDQVTVIDSSA